MIDLRFSTCSEKQDFDMDLDEIKEALEADKEKKEIQVTVEHCSVEKAERIAEQINMDPEIKYSSLYYNGPTNMLRLIVKKNADALQNQDKEVDLNKFYKNLFTPHLAQARGELYVDFLKRLGENGIIISKVNS